MKCNLKPGSLLIRSKGIVEHVGIYLGYGRVIHTVPETGIAVVNIEQFGAGRDIRTIKAENVDEPTLAARIKELVAGNKEYSLLSNNCQHIANFILTGSKKSPQLQWSFTCALVASLYAVYRRQNPLPYLAVGGLAGCIGYSMSTRFMEQHPEA